MTYLSPEQIAERLGVSRATGYRIVKEIGIAASSPIGVEERRFDRYIASRLRGGDRSKGSSLDRRHPLVLMLADEFDASIATLPACCTHDGFTYFVGAVSLVKIGCTINPRTRALDLQVGSPVPLRLIAIARDSTLEERLHVGLRDHRAHGEWFDAEPLLIALGEVQRIADAKRCCLRCAWEGP